jgi:osmoprotectant transport system ATP-binding protein
MIELRGIAKRYDGALALGPLDLELPAGRTTALIGPSGCGKSTLLRLIVGLIRPDAGGVRIGGIEVGDETLPELRLRMGYVIQEGGLFPHLTARDNAAIMAQHLNWDLARTDARIAELAALVRLPAEALDRFPAQLSGGQRQRVSLMRALLLDPDVILLDEPLGALDPMIRADLQTDLRDIFARLGKTVVLVTHDLAEAGYLAQSLILLRDGKVVQRGSLDELVRSPADDFVTKFVHAQRGVA